MFRLIDIHKNYGKVEVLKGVSMEIPFHEVTTIVGPSGAGKTTLLQIMASLEKPDGGSVVFDGKDLFRMREKELAHFRNQNIGLVFQQHRLLPEFSIIENVMMPALIAGQSNRKARQEAAKLLAGLGLEHRLSHKPSQLSGGECQRAAVARAMINHPAIILADEPSGSLDSENRRMLHRIFFELRDNYGTTFAIVTHDESLAADSDRIIRLRDGQIDRIETASGHCPDDTEDLIPDTVEGEVAEL